MNAVRLYLTTCRYVMQAEECVADLYRLLPYLRQALSCCVCGQLLRRPCGPEPNVCQHFVCTGCVGGKMNLKPSCSWCKDSSLFVENTQIWILVHCFKKLCEYLNNSRFVRELQQPSGSGEANGLVLLVQEAMAFDDNYASSIEEKLSSIPSLTTFSLKRKEHHPSCDFLNADLCLKTPPTPFHTSSHHSVKQEPGSPTAATTTTVQHCRVGAEELDKVAEKLSNDCKDGQTINDNSSSSGNKREAVSVRCPVERKKRSLWNSRGELACLSVNCNDEDDEGSSSEIDLQPSSSPCKKFCSDEDNNTNNQSSSKKSKVDNSRRSSWSGIIEAVHKHRLISTSGHS
ncbi:uncharacterized protein LOC115222248 isoform X2 [Octopus sinensis]|uniref:Uncharacterized protein LOC115222248 isoform X2 n=1 Tax=Octopus sinensis TaxID=2607531 RepID=A0A7E6FH05_9MOLL|nr:uncharacterized protein LOC115222248 isoform X2 [Octopus sinensis]